MADTTPTLREAAQQALEALRECELFIRVIGLDSQPAAKVAESARATITALRAALAEQAGPPPHPSYPHITQPYTLEEIRAQIASHDYSAELLLQHAMLLLDDTEQAEPQWQPIETAPKTGAKIIVRYVNRNNKPRTVMARWLTDEQAEETDADGVGLKGGWYECIDNWDDYTEVAIHEGEPSLWMPLPAAPLTAEGGAA